MAITLGNVVSSGYRAGSTYTVSYTTTTNTKGLVVIVTGNDTSDTDFATTVTFNSVNVPSLRAYRVTPYKHEFFYLSNPSITTADVVVTFGGYITAFEFSMIGLESTVLNNFIKNNIK